MRHSKKERKSKIGRFVQKHSSVLTFIGAMTVFTTFVVKEGLRERVKDLKDAIDSAQTTFLLMNQQSEMTERLNAILELVAMPLHHSTKKNSEKTTTTRPPEDEIVSIGIAAEQLKNDLANIRRLSEAVPGALPDCVKFPNNV